MANLELVKDQTHMLSHNPDSNCVACCANSERLNDLVVKVETIVNSITPETIEAMTKNPIFKMLGKFGG